MNGSKPEELILVPVFFRILVSGSNKDLWVSLINLIFVVFVLNQTFIYFSYILRMKEFERERRLLERQKRIDSKLALA